MADTTDKPIGPGTGIQVSLLIVVLSAVAAGGVWVGQSRAEFETLKALVYEIRADVKYLSQQVHQLPGGK